MYAERVIFFYINRAFQSTLSISKRPCIQLYMVEMLRIPLQDLIHLYLGKLARTIHMNYARNSIVLCMPVISHYARAYTCTGTTKYVIQIQILILFLIVQVLLSKFIGFKPSSREDRAM